MKTVMSLKHNISANKVSNLYYIVVMKVSLIHSTVATQDLFDSN